MATTVKGITARIPHLCDGCHWDSNLRGVPTIAPGHRYLRHVVFPGDDVNQSDHPIVHVECVACAEDRGMHEETLVGDACATYCCGDVPCALPVKHKDDHSCRRCTADLARANAEIRQLTEENIHELYGWIDAGKPHYAPGSVIDGLSVYGTQGRQVALFGDYIIKHGTGGFCVRKNVEVTV
jgi:hypothetical protein